MKKKYSKSVLPLQSATLPLPSLSIPGILNERVKAFAKDENNEWWTYYSIPFLRDSQFCGIIAKPVPAVNMSEYDDDDWRNTCHIVKDGRCERMSQSTFVLQKETLEKEDTSYE